MATLKTVIGNVKGPKGDKGEIGPAGPAGPKGEQGIQGNTGPTGAQGPAGPEGPIGNTGPAGPAGPAGPKGDPGPAGPTGPKGDPGTTDFNDLQNKPDLILRSGGTFTGLVKVTKTNNAFEFNSDSNQPQFIEFRKGAARKVYLGSSTGSDQNKFEIAGENGAYFVINGFSNLTARLAYVELGNSLRLGYGQDFANFSPEGNRTKKLRFFNNAIGNNAYFDLETLGTLELNTNSVNNGRTCDIYFKRNGQGKGQIGYTNGKLFIWNETSGKTFEMQDNGNTKLPAANLVDTSKEVIQSINNNTNAVSKIKTEKWDNTLVQSWSSTDGTQNWVKYPNGVLEQWGRYTTNIDGSVNRYFNINFPVAFSKKPSGVCSTYYNLNEESRVPQCSFYNDGIRGNVPLNFKLNFRVSENDGLYWYAIGFWK